MIYTKNTIYLFIFAILFFFYCASEEPKEAPHDEPAKVEVPKKEEPEIIDEKELEKFKAEELQWDEIKKSKKFKVIYDWEPSKKNKNLKERMKKDFSSIVINKVSSYCKKSFPSFAKDCGTEIIFPNGNQAGIKIEELFLTSFLSKNPHTGEKIETKDFKLEKSDFGDFQLLINNEAEETKSYIYFKRNKDKIAVIGLQIGFNRRNPQGWEYGVSQIFNSFTKWPDSGYWDFEFIDKF